MTLINQISPGGLSAITPGAAAASSSSSNAAGASAKSSAQSNSGGQKPAAGGSFGDAFAKVSDQASAQSKTRSDAAGNKTSGKGAGDSGGGNAQQHGSSTDEVSVPTAGTESATTINPLEPTAEQAVLINEVSLDGAPVESIAVLDVAAANNLELETSEAADQVVLPGALLQENLPGTSRPGLINEEGLGVTSQLAAEQQSVAALQQTQATPLMRTISGLSLQGAPGAGSRSETAGLSVATGGESVSGITLAALRSAELQAQPVQSTLTAATAGLTAEKATAALNIPAATIAATDNTASALAEAGGDTLEFAKLLQEGLGAEAGSAKAAARTETAAQAMQTQSLQNAALAQTNATARMTMPVEVRFGTEQWAGVLAERTAGLVMQNIQNAQIQLDPPELGPLAVRVQVSNDQATVNFVTANPAVRDALDQTMNRLRDMLQEQGLNLTDASVSDQSSQQQSGDGSREAEGQGSLALGADGEVIEGEGVDSVVNLAVNDGIDDFV